VLEKQTVNSKFHKEVIKKLVAWVHRVMPEFQESGHWHILLDFVSEFLEKRWIPMLSHPPYSPDERDEIWGCFTNSTDFRENWRW
jgi:hypothetical protein